MFNSGTKAKYPKKYFTCNATTQVARLRISKFLTVALPGLLLRDFAYINRYFSFSATQQQVLL